MKTTNNNRFIFFFFCLFSFLIVLIPISNSVRALFLNINANDFSIYQQAIYDLSFDNLNPYLTIKGTGIFNDHVDPIIFLAALWCKVWGYTPYSLIFFEWMWFVLLIICTFVLIKNERKNNTAKILFSLSLIIFSRSFLQGLEFPIHPTTWSMLPLFLLFYFLIKDKFIPVVIFSFIICWYREIFPLMLISFSSYFLLNKKFKRFVVIFSIGATHYYLYSHLRPILLGPTVDYGDTLLKQLIEQHIFFIWERFKTFSFPYKVFVPYIFISLLFFKYEIKIKSLHPLQSLQSLIKHPLTAAILFVGPMFFLHALANYMVHHHSVPMIVPFLAVIIFSSLSDHILKNKLLLYSIIIIFLCLSSSRYTKMVKNTLLLDKDANYSYEEAREKLRALKEIKDKIYKIVILNKDTKILASGGVIASILKPNMKLYQFCEVTDNTLSFDYLLLEKRAHGDLNPLVFKDIIQIESDCMKYKAETVIDNQFFILMKGNFDDRCLKMSKRWPTPSTLIPKEKA
ncbi:MAG: hypothetical protein HQK49_12840 [Oligoflexia bacterium]|nr:hypothetical protein [Oligoflexia bacterium]